ncbi:antitermination protein NusB [Gilvimarinus agarilyticus]|uniref:antitermination protein NusB n=1 Tax=unclassified Gilvimarinus TaxID=2642066 RepID=UPI001C09D78A|nr:MULTISPECIES: antitermination protein NusB [unclassified Gilvimarinus]MBU2886340.1 antitermination protein NusB [Gilvimarinus agarilyticus]MDO6571026.1 antitermination protein NusB [Gilvimarinus sp. 2_MG-2023]MDO6747986.1 antitermination protein NusB [Gilvimarinus sp. 1_MG-2023]
MNEVDFLAQSGGYAVGWGTLALINAGIAQGKNRSGLAWFLLSILLGPIATLILVILDKRREF